MGHVAFHCIRCRAEGLPYLVTEPLDQYVLEITARSRDGKRRLAQARIEDLCKRHAREAIATWAKGNRKPVDPMDTLSLF